MQIVLQLDPAGVSDTMFSNYDPSHNWDVNDWLGSSN